MDFSKILKQAQRAQQDMQRVQAGLAQLTVEGAAAGGKVTVTATAGWSDLPRQLPRPRHHRPMRPPALLPPVPDPWDEIVRGSAGLSEPLLLVALCRTMRIRPPRP